MEILCHPNYKNRWKKKVKQSWPIHSVKPVTIIRVTTILEYIEHTKDLTINTAERNSQFVTYQNTRIPKTPTTNALYRCILNALKKVEINTII